MSVPNDIEVEKLFSNSVVELGVESDVPIRPYFNWKLSRESSPSWAEILHLPCDLKGSQVNKYVCSPLDYGANLEVCVQENESGEILSKISYPTINLEKELIHNLSLFKAYYQVGLIFPKNFLYPATISISSALQLYIQMHQVQPFIIKLKQSPQNLPSKGVVRIDPNESNTLRIYIQDYLPVLKKTLSKLKLLSPSGQYLKILFEDRLNRDAFLCILLRKSGCIFDELEAYFQKNLLQTNIKKINFKVKLDQVSPESKKISLPPPQLQKLSEIKESHFLEDFQSTNNISSENSGTKKLQDFHDKKWNEGFKYLSGLQSQITESSTSSEDHKKIVGKNKKYQQNSKGYEEELKDQTNPQQPGTHERQKQVNRLMMNKNVDKLLSLNVGLMEKNKQLKAENIRLKSSKVHTKFSTYKMIELKSVVSNMAQRLHYLQQRNSEGHTDHDPHQKGMSYQLNQKNFFSAPRTKYQGKIMNPLRKMSKSPRPFALE